MLKCIFIILTFLSFKLSTSIADDSCLKIVKPDQNLLFLCGHEDTAGQNFYAYNNLQICFVGSAQMLTDKINGGLFKNQDAGLSNATKINAYAIALTFWNHNEQPLKKTIKKCE